MLAYLNLTKYVTICTLAHHYRCNVEETLSEWKEVIFSLKQMTTVREALHYLAAFNHVGYPNLAKIASSLLVVPVHSADCK